jgi:hypothetical protein
VKTKYSQPYHSAMPNICNREFLGFPEATEEISYIPNVKLIILRWILLISLKPCNYEIRATHSCGSFVSEFVSDTKMCKLLSGELRLLPLVSCLAYYSTLKMDPPCSSETSYLLRPTQYYNRILRSHLSEILNPILLTYTYLLCSLLSRTLHSHLWYNLRRREYLML